jgi:hypothetical protein
MKLATNLLVAGLLLATASAVGAAEAEGAPDPAPAPQSEASPSLSLVGEWLVAASPDCGAGGEALLSLGGQEPVPTAMNCGACSTSNCVGVPRGTPCSLGGGQGSGHCNNYSGGFTCPQGGWECQCGQGPLP